MRTGGEVFYVGLFEVVQDGVAPTEMQGGVYRREAMSFWDIRPAADETKRRLSLGEPYPSVVHRQDEVTYLGLFEKAGGGAPLDVRP